MTAQRDFEGLIEAFLEDGPRVLPNRSYDAVRAAIEHTRQRVVIGPWRIDQVTRFATYGIAAAAVVLIAVMGIGLLPAGGDPFAPGASPLGSPAGTPAATATPEPASTAIAGPTSSPTAASTPIADPSGRLRPGTYAVHPFDTRDEMDGRRFTFTVASPNWEAVGEPGNTTGIVWNDGSNDNFGLGFGFLKVHSLNSDACHWATDEDIAIGPTALELLEALDGADTVELETNRTDLVTLTMPATLPPDCDEGEYRIWNAEGFDIPALEPSNIWRIFMDDFGGRYVVLLSHTPETPAEVINELETMFRSVTSSDDPGCSQFAESCD